MNVHVPAFDFDKYTDQYVKLRDKVKEIKDRHKEELAPFDTAMEKLEGLFLAKLIETGQDSAKSKAGTVYKTEKASASLADPEAFLDYVRQSENFDLLDRKANVTAVKDHVAKYGELPPGVNLSTRTEVGIRRASAK